MEKDIFDNWDEEEFDEQEEIKLEGTLFKDWDDYEKMWGESSNNWGEITYSSTNSDYIQWIPTNWDYSTSFKSDTWTDHYQTVTITSTPSGTLHTIKFYK